MLWRRGEKLGLPPAVIEMLARYRGLHDEQGYGWGEDELPDFFRWARFSLLGPAFDEFAGSGDWSAAVRAAVGDEVPAGLLLVSIGDGGELAARGGPPRPVIAGSTVPVDVVLDSAAESDFVVTVAGVPVPVTASGTGLHTVDLTADATSITLGCAGAGAGRTGRGDRRPSRDGAVDQPARRPLVDHRRHRRRLVRDRGAAQVGRRAPGLLPHRAGGLGGCRRAGRPAARRRGPRAGVRAARARRAPRLRRAGRDRLPARPPVRPDRRRLVRRRPARAPQLQRRPRARPGRRGPDAARRGAALHAADRREHGRLAGLRRGAARPPRSVPTCPPRAPTRWPGPGWSSATTCSDTCTDWA